MLNLSVVPMSTGKADEHCARLELGRHCSVVWLISVLGALGATAQLGRNMARCSLERWAGKATVMRHGGLVPVGGQRAARHGPGRARAPALPRAQAHRQAHANTPDMRHL